MHIKTVLWIQNDFFGSGYGSCFESCMAFSNSLFIPEITKRYILYKLVSNLNFLGDYFDEKSEFFYLIVHLVEKLWILSAWHIVVLFQIHFGSGDARILIFRIFGVDEVAEFFTMNFGTAVRHVPISMIWMFASKCTRKDLVEPAQTTYYRSFHL